MSPPPSNKPPSHDRTDSLGVEKKRFSRAAPSDFGARLAMARNTHTPSVSAPIPGLGQTSPALPSVAPSRQASLGSLSLDSLPHNKRSSFGAIGQQRGSTVLSPPADVQERIVFAGPLRMVRSQISKDPAMAVLRKFLDRIFPEGGHISTEYDEVIPTVVYSWTYKVEDQDWEIYKQMLVKAFPLEGEMERLLAFGRIEHANSMETFGVFKKGQSLEELFRELTKRHCLGFNYDRARPWATHSVM